MNYYLLFIPITAAFLTLTACEQTTRTEQTSLQEVMIQQDSIQAIERRDSLAAIAAANKPKTPEQSLKEDAQLAQKMSLSKFSKHMQTRKAYYSKYKEVKYEDEFVKIKISDGDMKIETPEGKAKFEEGETKIKTDTYKRKTEKE